MTRKNQLGRQFSEGSRRLWQLMHERGWRQTDLARTLGNKNTGTINRWLYGERSPDLDSALFIQNTLGIEVNLWAQKPIEPFTLPSSEQEAVA